ncbi:hypothetical protein [Cedecea lapagei]|uniref:hypothetical protein n=1 Tax=Cedecea lapagei TaxID=158823 RepID=UPI002022F8BF|nr:hypothetical protein [Cedecea lapagei]
MSVSGLDNVKKFINKKGKALTKDIEKQLITRTKELSQRLQQDMDKNIEGGAVPFTKRAVLFFYNRTSTGVKMTIAIRDIQAEYLYEIIVKQRAISKFVPVPGVTKLTKEGNISGLRSGLKSGKYKVVKSKKGKHRLIDTKQKDRKKRVIGVKETKRRKMVYDFYTEAESGAMLIIRDIKGQFKIRKA